MNESKVLVVDDSSVNITAAKGMLKAHHIIPDFALSGREAIEIVKEKDYDLVFMDHMMPEMDGVEATAVIRRLGGRYKTMPIIALTANTASGAREFLIQSGMTDFLSKPIDPKALKEILSAYLPQDYMPHKASDSSDDPRRLSELLSALSELPEIDVEWGLSHMGDNPNTYKTALNQLVYEIPKCINELFNDILERNLAHYAVVVHGMKGIFATVGAESLAEWAFFLEKSAKANKWKLCEREMENFPEAVISFIKKLKPLLRKSRPASIQGKQQASADQLAEMLSPFKMACELGDCTTIDNLAASLKKQSFGENYNSDLLEIIALTEYMEYGKAAGKIDKMLIRLGRMKPTPNG